MGSFNKLMDSGMGGVLPMMLSKKKPDTWSSPSGLMNMMKDNTSQKLKANGLINNNKPDMMGLLGEKTKKPIDYL